MQIKVVLEQQYTGDVSIEELIRQLDEAGYDVTIKKKRKVNQKEVIGGEE